MNLISGVIVNFRLSSTVQSRVCVCVLCVRLVKSVRVHKLTSAATEEEEEEEECAKVRAEKEGEYSIEISSCIVCTPH